MYLSTLAIFLGCIVYLHAVPFPVSKSDVFPPLSQCGHQSLPNIEATPGETNRQEFPWIVYIPLETRTFNPSSHPICAGVLISKRYVLFAKSCMQFVLSKVELQRHNILLGSNDNPIQLDVESRIVNETNNIAMLRLSSDVTFSENVQPICLPWEDFPRATQGKTVFTSGWGLTSASGSNSNIKKKVDGTIVDNNECSKSVDPSNPIPEESLLCIKTKPNTIGLYCSGDEGSPVMYNSNEQWFVEGILTNVFDGVSSPCTTAAGSWKVNENLINWIIENAKE